MSRCEKQKRRLWLLGAVAAVGLILWIVLGNTQVTLSRITVEDERIPDGFSGFRIAQVSDLHNAQFGPDNAQLLALLYEQKPDIIVITGDLVDSRRTDVEVALSFARQAVQLAPVYYVSGNHESRIAQYDALKAGLVAAGVTVLENESVECKRNGQTITIAGMSDPQFLRQSPQEILPGLMGEGYTLLLSHRPELMETYAQAGASLVLTGHVHGGQFRLPFAGGVYGPHQGFFPEYDAGLYQLGQTQMVVSRGLGNSLFPFRLNNPPELVMIKLQSV